MTHAIKERSPAADSRVDSHRDFVLRATELLTSSLDYRAALKAVADLAVPDMADWCAIHLLEGKELKHVAVAHQDPRRAEWARELGERFPADPSSPTGIYNVVRSGEPELYTEITDEMLQQGAQSEEHLQVLRSIDIREAMIVPLSSRSRTLGTITFVSSKTRHVFDTTALERACEIGRLAGTAVDNALLYQASQEAQRRMAVLAEASAALLGDLNTSAVLPKLLELSGEVLAADGHAVWTKDSSTGRWSVAASRGVSETYIREASDLISNTPDEVISFDNPIVAEDITAAPWVSAHLNAHVKEGTRSLLVAPFKGERGLAGTIAFYFRHPRVFDDSEVKAAQALANLAGAAIRIYQIYKAEQDARERAEHDLVDRARLAAIVDSSEDAIVSKDLNGIVTSWNRSAERIYGWKAEDIIGKSKALVIPPDLPNELSGILDKIKRGERIEHYETRRLHKNGTVFDVAISVSPVKNAAGEITGAATIVRDISSQVKARQEIEALNERLKRAMQETHHRVKNNLQIIAAMVELQVFERAREQHVPIEDFARLGGHIRTLAAVHDVLTQYVREDEREQLVSLQSVFNSLIPLLRQAAGDRVVCAEIDDVHLTGKQATALALVANELVYNALKYGEGPVEIRLAASQNNVELAVQDEGPGFPDGFTMAGAASTGLQLVEALTITDLGGQLFFGNRSTGGAKVSITIPICSERHPAPAQ